MQKYNQYFHMHDESEKQDLVTRQQYVNLFCFCARDKFSVGIQGKKKTWTDINDTYNCQVEYSFNGVDFTTWGDNYSDSDLNDIQVVKSHIAPNGISADQEHTITWDDVNFDYVIKYEKAGCFIAVSTSGSIYYSRLSTSGNYIADRWILYPNPDFKNLFNRKNISFNCIKQ